MPERLSSTGSWRRREQVWRERAQMLEEGLPGRNIRGAYRLVAATERIAHGMGEDSIGKEGQQD
jgi:hypothetical protein